MKGIKLCTSASGNLCINIKARFPINAMSVPFSVKTLTKRGKTQTAAKLHCQFCHPPFTYLKKVLHI